VKGDQGSRKRYLNKDQSAPIPDKKLSNLVDVLFRNRIDHFTVVCSVTGPLHGSEAGVDLVLIQTSLLLLCKTSCSDAN